jgi:hypothetical protein
MSNHALVTMLCAALALTACTTTLPQETPAEVKEADGRIYITDRTGKQWDVTGAVEDYGFVAEAFQFGLGPHAIHPINFPHMIAPGETGYPDPENTDIVIGTRVGDDARAYALQDLHYREVVNERIGDEVLLVGW